MTGFFLWLSIVQSLDPAEKAAWSASLSLGAFDVNAVSTSNLQTQLSPALSSATAPVCARLQQISLFEALFALNAT